MRRNLETTARSLTAVVAMCLAASQVSAQTTDTRTNLFISTVRPNANTAKSDTASSLSLAQFELGLSIMPVKSVGHGGGPDLMSGGSSGNPSPSIYGFCYEACATSRAVGSCGTGTALFLAPPTQSCNPVIDTPLLDSIIGPRLGVGQSPFVDNQSGPEGAQPAGYTFLGQFVDHDVTRTQTDLSSAEELLSQTQADPAFAAQLEQLGVSADLLKQALTAATSATSPISVNTGKLDLDSVYGVPNYHTLTQISAPWFEQQNGQYTGRFAQQHVLAPTSTAAPKQIDGFDYVRLEDGTAEIPDPRNSEHKILAQIQGLFELAHNDCVNTALADTDTPTQAQIRVAFDACHDKVRWTYQTIVATDFLPRISAEAAISRIAPGALHHYTRGEVATSVLPRPGGVHTFIYQCKYGAGADAVIRIPHEFAVAGFRLGHTLVRDEYVLHQQVLDPSGNLMTGGPRPIFADATQDQTLGLVGNNPVAPQDVIDWSYFFDMAAGSAQPLRPLDTLIADKLFSLPVAAIPPGNGLGGKDTPTERNLARRNIFRASAQTDTLSGSVGLGTGEAEEAYALARIPHLADTRSAVQTVLAHRLTSAGFPADSFAGRTPLWLYILAEGEGTQGSHNLGELGSHIVDEFLLGGLQCDAGSVLYARPAAMQGWGPTEAIARSHRYSVPDLIAHLQANMRVNGHAIRLTSR